MFNEHANVYQNEIEIFFFLQKYYVFKMYGQYRACTIRTKSHPHSAILTHALCTMEEEFLIDNHMIPHQSSTWYIY